MRFPLIAMMLTAFAVIVGLLGIAQLTRDNGTDLPDAPDAPAEQTTETGERSAVRPVQFGSISETNGMLRLSGTSEPEATLSIVSGGVVVQQTRVSEDGRWSSVLPIFGADTQMIDLIMSLPSGDNIRSDETLFRIPHPAPETEAGEGEAIEAPSAASVKPALILRTTPGAPSTLIQSPFGTMPTVGPLSLGPIDYDDSGGAVFRGTSERSGRVRLVVQGGGVIDDQPVQEDGQWFFIVSETLPTGRYNISVQLMSDGFDNVVLTVPFERLSPRRAEQVAGFPVSAMYRDDSWQVRRELLGGGAQYTVIFATALNQSEDEAAATDAVPSPPNSANDEQP